IVGGAGDDYIYLGIGQDSVDGGAGTDAAQYYYTPNSVTVNLATGRATSGGSSTSLTSIENVYGSQYDDHLAGDAGANLLAGNGGNDTLNGGLGNDTLQGNNYAGYSNVHFAFSALGSANADVVLGFVTGSDKIELDSSVFTG